MRVVPALDEVEDAAAASRCVLKRAGQQLAFERSVEALAHRVVVAVSTDPIDGRMPASSQRIPKAIDVYWEP